MAYVSQENKQAKSPIIKEICKKYGVKGTLSIRDHMTLVLTVSSGTLDFGDIDGHANVNQYHYAKKFTGAAREFLKEAFAAMSEGNHDRSDVQRDYFDVGWYIDISIGRWNKPYQLNA